MMLTLDQARQVAEQALGIRTEPWGLQFPGGDIIVTPVEEDAVLNDMSLVVHDDGTVTEALLTDEDAADLEPIGVLPLAWMDAETTNG